MKRMHLVVAVASCIFLPLCDMTLAQSQVQGQQVTSKEVFPRATLTVDGHLSYLASEQFPRYFGPAR